MTFAELISKINGNNLLYSLIANALSALSIGLIFFLLKEKLFSPPNLNGRFYLKLNVLETSYRPYREMELQFQLHISSGNKIVIGGGEKIYEKSPHSTNGDQVIHFKGKYKTPIEIKGNIETKIFGPDKIYLFFKIFDTSRPSTMVIILEKSYRDCANKNKDLLGKYTWSVANKYGNATLSENNFPQEDEKFIT